MFTIRHESIQESIHFGIGRFVSVFMLNIHFKQQMLKLMLTFINKRRSFAEILNFDELL